MRYLPTSNTNIGRLEVDDRFYWSDYKTPLTITEVKDDGEVVCNGWAKRVHRLTVKGTYEVDAVVKNMNDVIRWGTNVIRL